MSKSYDDKAKCPAGHRFRILRRATSADQMVITYCQMCKRSYNIKAGPLPKAKP